MRRILLVLLCLLLGGPLALFVYFEDIHLPERTFDTFSDMRRSNLDPGWFPQHILRSATGIREAHNLDSNVSWTTFSIPLSDLPDFTHFMMRVDRQRPPWVHWRVRWWPDNLAPTAPAVIRPDPFAYYATRNGEYTYAVDTLTGRVYGWSRGG